MFKNTAHFGLLDHGSSQKNYLQNFLFLNKNYLLTKNSYC